MKITITQKEDVEQVALEGRLDTLTAPDLEKELGTLEGVKELYIDCRDLDYISSAGLRILLSMQKTMNRQGRMYVANVRQEVMEVLELTGFTGILHIV